MHCATAHLARNFRVVATSVFFVEGFAEAPLSFNCIAPLNDEQTNAVPRVPTHLARTFCVPPTFVVRRKFAEAL